MKNNGSEMLHIGWVIVNCFADTCSKIFTDVTPCLLKVTGDIAYPVTGRYLLQPHQVTKLIERHTTIQKDATHHVLFTAKQTIGSHMMMLPHRTEPRLYSTTIVHFTNLLELVNTHDNVPVFLHSNLFHHV